MNTTNYNIKKCESQAKKSVFSENIDAFRIKNQNKAEKKATVTASKTNKKTYFEPNEDVKCIILGKNHLEIVDVTFKTEPKTVKIDKYHYRVIETGEIKKYNQSETKSIKNIKRVHNELLKLTRCNFEKGAKNQLFITLTYAQNIFTINQAYKDFKNFIKELRNKMKDHQLEYIVVPEPDADGAWHLHALIKSNKNKLYISNEDIQDVWCHGWTDTKRIKDEDIGLYFKMNFNTVEKGKRKTKAHWKAEKLCHYNRDAKMYMCSSGIARPVVEIRKYSDVTDEYGEPNYANTIDVTDDIGNVVNKVHKESFKKKKNKSNTSKKKAKEIEIVNENDKKVTALDRAKDFLFEHLKDGMKPSKDIKATAKIQGISESTLKRARIAIGVDCSHRKGHRKDVKVFWVLPNLSNLSKIS